MTSRYQQLRARVIEHLGESCGRCGFGGLAALEIHTMVQGSFVKRFKAILEGAPGYLLCANCAAIERAAARDTLTLEEMKRMTDV